MTIPSPDEILSYISNSTRPLTKRELARAFKIKGDDRIPFKKLLRKLDNDGIIIKQTGGGFSVPDALPAVTIVEVTDIDVDGDVIARPAEWQDDTQGPAPRIEVAPGKKGHPALKQGDRVLARLNRQSDTVYAAIPIKRLDEPQNRVLGVVRKKRQGYILQPTDKKAKYDFEIHQADLNGAKPGDLAVAEVQPSRGLRQKKVRIIETIGDEADPKAISLIAMHAVNLRIEFPEAVLNETQNMRVPDLKGRKDLRDIPLVTIDGADARDFDDAVYAEELEDGGFHLIVAIADVSHYVKHGKALDDEAYRRGNSTYFPDRVVPMLPEKLSNDLCSLRPNEPRACMAMHMKIDNEGRLRNAKIERGIMRSAARLVYEQVQAAYDGQEDDLTGPLMDSVIRPLYKAYDILWQAREKRGALNLDLPEKQIIIDDNNVMTGVKTRDRLDSHKLIEEFMILANVAAARLLEDKQAPCVYRVHDKPDPSKIDATRDVIESFGISFPKGQVVKPGMINDILDKAAAMPYGQLVSQVILRAQSQARYHPENIGHFGLALSKYAHFTSPIRRYADLIVHRSLIRAYGLGDGGLSEDEELHLNERCEHISTTERTSMEAERNAVDRFTAAYLSTQIGATFTGRISGATRFGLFVELHETGADGLVPIRSLPKDYYVHDEDQHALIGRDSGRIYRMGATVSVNLTEADPLTGSTIFNLANDESADIPGLQMKAPQLNPKRSGKNQRKGRHRGGQKPNKRKYKKKR